MRVLAVDDDADFLDLLGFQFLQADITLEPCTSGSQALRLLDERCFDVVMVDLIMPAMDGRALVRHIRRRPRVADIPIIMMTHMANVRSINAANPGEANHFVDKGGEPECLIQLVSHLGGRRAALRTV